ncbi:limonoid 21-O-acetyltransferse [Nicotiana tabacum]|uniref:Limonoid 21-O-acetyltransferse n=2 Tax=Nicotiana TaxID=4085 RepID=A0A1S4BEY8_TOBAC|nr:PREDICTED: pelargonidin 3-O-(6-caffeoylglucoside) 5-O-(6-O-malonylglucoside) 4'''-malonyltransferase-like [Nicotiana sylvestris]XP_016487386.1 PREDICTED: pelargonidin 3-O-(6-caffeoylglucoside) 5-O-(6-O-malonylglucoside) 4'''-malonyltransferase-like [Nicotiana tabacum]
MGSQSAALQVKILSTNFITPSSPTPNHLQNYKLSFFDQIAEDVHLPLVLFYPPNDKNSTTDEQLEESLSRVLIHVYPIAGRFTEDFCSINCLDQGVKFVRANVNSKLDDFLEQAHKDVNAALLCWPHDTWTVDEGNLAITPLVIVQVTRFECGGIALSMSHAHIAMDGFSSLSFLYEWSKVCRLGIPTKEINFLSFNLGEIFPSRDLSKLLLPRIPGEKRAESKLVAKRLYIDESAISKLRDEMTGLSFKPTRVEMITAVLWRALIRASEAKNRNMRRSLMGVPVNLRSKISLPQIEKCFGNLVVDSPVKFVPGETKMELHNMVALIRDTVQKTIEYCNKESPDEIVSAVADLYNGSFQANDWGASHEVDAFTCSSLCRFPILGADFGWGKPCLMHFGSRHNQTCWLYDAECGNGVCVQVDIKESYMRFFECDQDIKAYFNW